MQTPEAVVFDIGNVRIEWQPERYYDSRLGADRRRAGLAGASVHNAPSMGRTAGDSRIIDG